MPAIFKDLWFRNVTVPTNFSDFFELGSDPKEPGAHARTFSGFFCKDPVVSFNPDLGLFELTNFAVEAYLYDKVNRPSLREIPRNWGRSWAIQKVLEADQARRGNGASASRASNDLDHPKHHKPSCSVQSARSQA
jgi:hypothetical protein